VFLGIRTNFIISLLTCYKVDLRFLFSINKHILLSIIKIIPAHITPITAPPRTSKG